MGTFKEIFRYRSHLVAVSALTNRIVCLNIVTRQICRHQQPVVDNGSGEEARKSSKSSSSTSGVLISLKQESKSEDHTFPMNKQIGKSAQRVEVVERQSKENNDMGAFVLSALRCRGPIGFQRRLKSVQTQRMSTESPQPSS